METIYQFWKKREILLTHGEILQILNEKEHCAYAALPSYRQEDFLYGRHVLKEMGAKLCRCDAAAVAVAVVDAKPILSIDGTTYYCSLSHSANYVACAIHSHAHPGIDVEEVRPRAHALLRYIATADEQRICAALVPQEHLATVVWNIKEAAFKADPQQQPLARYVITAYAANIATVANMTSKTSLLVQHRLHNGVTQAVVI